MSSDRPKVGDAFRAPDRVTGLTGLLDDTSGPAPMPPAATAATSTEQPRPSTPRPASPNGSTAAPQVRVVPVVLDASLLSDLRTFAVRSELTHGTVTLRAIEANAEQLTGHWSRASEPTESPGRLFGNSQRVRRRTEPGVQTQLRLAADDAATLDRLVRDWSAPSRSALVNEALRRYIRPRPTAEAGQRETIS